MNQNHWRVIAILGGLAAGFFLTSQFTGYSWPAQIYNQGATAGGSLNA
jgi:hypothetical protein